jgi:hypothetical protein
MPSSIPFDGRCRWNKSENSNDQEDNTEKKRGCFNHLVSSASVEAEPVYDGRAADGKQKIG